MVPMRDGVRLAFDVYRPGLAGSFAEGRYPAIMLHTPYDKAAKRYTLVVAEQAVYLDAAHPSRIVLPVIPERT